MMTRIRALMIALTWMLMAISAFAQPNEGLVLPQKPLRARYFGVNTTEYVWVRPVPVHVRVAQVGLVALQVADLVTTHMVLTTGYGREANPVMNLLSAGGTSIGGMVPIKFAATYVVLWNQRHRQHAYPKITTVSTVVGMLPLMWVVQHNWHVKQEIERRQR